MLRWCIDNYILDKYSEYIYNDFIIQVGWFDWNVYNKEIKLFFVDIYYISYLK